jgi:hypothetical protein
MRLKKVFSVLILLLILAPVYTAFSTAWTGLRPVETELSNVTAVNNQSHENNWDFSKANEWKDYVVIDNDSIELVIGINSNHLDARTQIDDIVQRYHGRIVDEIRTQKVLQALVIDLPTESASLLAKELESSTLTRYVEPNAKFQIHFAPNDPLWSKEWGPQKIGADWAWNITIGSHAILVAVIDTGIFWTHPDLIANYVPLGYDWVNNDTDPMDDNGHGTHVAGIIAAVINNAVGIAGMAQVRIMAEKSLDATGSGNEADLAKAIIHATEQNANIISMSWGGNFNNTLINDAIKFAYNSGVLLVASAGNDRSDVKSYPAAYDEVIAVAATDQQDRPAFFTNFGEWIELAAPGVQIVSTILHDGYGNMSGTSMACPHVSGLAALVWSRFPTMTRDQVRYHLRYTADDLGDTGFDVVYGYGRINATQAISRFVPQHEVLISNLVNPPYVELNTTGVFKPTILNYGAANESNLTVRLLANDTIVSSDVINFLSSGSTATVEITWSPQSTGLYNITIQVLPVPGESMLANNQVSVYAYGGRPVKAFVIRSSGTYWTWITATWEKINDHWFELGANATFVDSTTLDKSNVTYEDLKNSDADVLIVSLADSPNFGWEFTDSEIDAITRYIYEGRGLIVTGDSFAVAVPNNSKLARLLGIDETIAWSTNSTRGLNILDPDHPLFRNIPNPYTLPFAKVTATPLGNWTKDSLVGGEYVALGSGNESAIVTYRGVVYSSVGLEFHATQNDVQFFYNAITWSRYQRPEHDLTVGLEAPPFLLPNEPVQLNATVTNIGRNNETSVELQLLIDGGVVNNATVAALSVDSSFDISYVWSTSVTATHNITASALPVPNEDNPLNNRLSRLVGVFEPIIHPEEGQWADYLLHTFTENTSILDDINFTYNRYVSSCQINVTYLHSSSGSTWTTSSIVNTITRVVEQGIWMGFWYPGWIEVNVTLGSNVRVLNGIGMIIANQKTNINNRTVECWSLFIGFRFENYTFYYDKTTGMLLGYDRVALSFRENLTVMSTNILLGAVINPKVGDYARYSVQYFVNDNISAKGTMNFSYVEFLDNLRIRVQVDSAMYDANDQLIENSSLSIVVNIQTRVIESGPTGWNGTYFFGWIETNINLHSPVRILNQTGTVVGTTEFTLGERFFETWVIYSASDLQADFFNSDKVSGVLVESTATNLTDLNQHTTFTLLQTSIDVTPPAISITTPANDAFVGTTEVEVCWIASDRETGIAYFLVYLDSFEVAHLGPDDSSYLFTRLAEGIHVLGVQAYDLAGNTNNAEVNVVIDVTPPVAYITAPLDLSYLRGVININFGGNDQWFDSMLLWLNDVPTVMLLPKGNYTYSWDTTALSDGNYTILLRVRDKAQNTAISQITVTVDNTDPVVQIVPPPTYVKGTMDLVVNAYDANLETVSLYVDDQIIDVWTSSGIHTSIWNTATSPDCAHTIKATVTDKANNHMEYSLQITTDNTPPTTLIISPLNSTYASQMVYIDFNVSDENLESATLAVDGETLADVTTITSYLWNTTETEDGQHILKLKSVDKAGSVTTTSITITVDNTNPVVDLVSPSDGKIVSGNVSIAFFARDRNLKNATLVLNEATFNVAGFTNLIFDTKTVQDGHYAVVVEAFDLAGNHGEATITIVVDNTKPAVVIGTPVDGAKLQGTVIVNFVASDNHLASVILHIDDMVFNVTGQTSFEWNTTEIGDDSHVLGVVATDAAGNEEETQVTVQTTNMQEATEESYASGRNLGILIGVLFALVGSLAYILGSKRLRSHPPEPAKQEPA